MTLLITVGVLAWLPGCGGSSTPKSNNVPDATPTAALEASEKAAAGASSVAIHASSRQGRGELRLDLQLNRQGGKGKISLLGMEFEIIRVGQALYVKGPPSLYAKLGIKKQIPNDTWVKLSAQNSLAALTDIRGETARVLSTSGSVTKGATTTLQGQPALELKTEGNQNGRLYIKTTGKPYPLKLEKQGHETAQITFTGWDEPVTVDAPASSTASAG